MLFLVLGSLLSAAPRNLRPHAALPTNAEAAPPLAPSDLARLSPNALAYVGDAVLELFWRTRSVWPPGKLASQQQNVVAAIRAETQARVLRALVDRSGRDGEFALAENELGVFKRGRNACARRGPLRLKASVYQDASGLEALVGYLYYADSERCDALLAALARIHALPDYGEAPEGGR
ncbi:ribonuclease III domain-containing protein [Pelagophyceae sp. CCMP2097]|nr:ribonuclease III domain-containing protein [Pelagophyceae sp. CCMP2097]